MKFELTILGSGGAIPTIKKKPTAQFLNIQDRFFLIDCGEGTQIQLRKFKCKFSKINHIFISHLHGDHYLGLIGFLSSLNLLGRTNDITIYAPGDLKKILDVHQEISGKGFNFNINLKPLNFKNKTLVFEDSILNIYSYPVSHSIPCCGFLFEEKPTKRKLIKEEIKDKNFDIETLRKLKEGDDCLINGELVKNESFTIAGPKSRSYAFCADTKYDENIPKYVPNVDLMYHEATFLENMRERAKKTYHSTALDAANIAKMSKTNQLLIGHFSARYDDMKGFEEEAKSIFTNTTAVNDGDIFNLNNQ